MVQFALVEMEVVGANANSIREGLNLDAIVNLCLLLDIGHGGATKEDPVDIDRLTHFKTQEPCELRRDQSNCVDVKSLMEKGVLRMDH